MNEVYPTEELEKKVIERFNSIDFHCIFSDNPDSLAKSIIEYMSPFSDYSTAVTVTAFLICPQCKNKFFVKILDQGKINWSTYFQQVPLVSMIVIPEMRNFEWMLTIYFYPQF